MPADRVTSHPRTELDSLGGGRPAYQPQAYFREHSIDELVPRSPAGKKMRAIVDLDHGDRATRLRSRLQNRRFPKHLVLAGWASSSRPRILPRQVPQGALAQIHGSCCLAPHQHGMEVFLLRVKSRPRNIRALPQRGPLRFANNKTQTVIMSGKVT